MFNICVCELEDLPVRCEMEYQSKLQVSFILLCGWIYFFLFPALLFM